MKRRLTSLNTGEMQIKTTSYHFMPIRMAIIKKLQKNQEISAGKDVDKLEHLFTARSVKWCKLLQTMMVPQKV